MALHKRLETFLLNLLAGFCGCALALLVPMFLMSLMVPATMFYYATLSPHGTLDPNAWMITGDEENGTLADRVMREKILNPLSHPMLASMAPVLVLTLMMTGCLLGCCCCGTSDGGDRVQQPPLKDDSSLHVTVSKQRRKQHQQRQ
jgi:hypothetical protein